LWIVCGKPVEFGFVPHDNAVVVGKCSAFVPNCQAGLLKQSRFGFVKQGWIFRSRPAKGRPPDASGATRASLQIRQIHMGSAHTGAAAD
jgi:hypothetical protein